MYLHQIWHTHSKLRPGSSFAVKFTYYKIQDGAGGHFEIHFNGCNSTVLAYISTKFDAVTENDVPQEVLKSKFSSRKIQDGGGRHF